MPVNDYFNQKIGRSLEGLNHPDGGSCVSGNPGSARKPGEVSSALDRMDSLLPMLAKELGLLREDLAPVLDQKKVDQSTRGKNEQPTSQLVLMAERIEKQAENIHEMVAFVQLLRCGLAL